MRHQGRLFLYFLAGAVVVTVLSVGIFLTISPEAAGSDDAEELTSPEGRIRIDQVLSYVDPRTVKGVGHDFETEAPAAVYVPTYLPEGFRHSHTRLMTKTSVGQLFEGEASAILMVVQSPSATQTAKAGFVEGLSLNGWSGFLIQGSWNELDGGAPTWDPDMRTTLLLEMDDGVVVLLGEGNSVPKQELVSIGRSLEPDPDILSSLLEEAAHPQRIAERLPSGFGTLYVPTYLPEGYVAQGGEARPQWGYTQLRYRNRCELLINQYAQDSPAGPETARRATFGPHETRVENGNQFHIGYRVAPKPESGITFYLSDPHPKLYDEHWFAHAGVWFNFRMDTRPICGAPDIQEVGRIANSLRPAT